MKDCEPNIPKYIDLLFNKTTTILIKNSPNFRHYKCNKELKFVKEIHIIAIQNDVKELLYLLEKEYNGEIKIKHKFFKKEYPKI